MSLFVAVFVTPKLPTSTLIVVISSYLYFPEKLLPCLTTELHIESYYFMVIKGITQSYK
jgi:hypothetical protein